MRSRKLSLVMDQVDVGLRTDKDGARHIKLHTAAEVPREMVTAHEVGKAGELVTLQCWCIETNALHADSCLQVQIRPLPQRRFVDSIEIVKERTEWLNSLVQVLTGTPRGV